MDDFGDDLATAFALFGDTALNGVISTEQDFDVFSIALAAGQKISVDVTQATSGDALEVIEVDLFNSSVTARDLEFSLEEGDPTNLSFTAPVADTYFIAVTGGLPALGAAFSTGGYTLTVDVDAPFTDAHGDNETIATTVTGETSIDAEIHNADDFDFFSLFLEANQRVLVTTQSRGTDDPLEVTGLAVSDLQGNVLGDDAVTGIGEIASLDFTAPTAQTYIFAAAGSPSITGFPEASGDYTITFDFIQPGDLPDLTAAISLVSGPDQNGVADASVTLTNAGSAPASTVRSSVVLSADDVIDITDLQLAVPATVDLTPGQSVTVPVQITLPSDLADGDYRLGVLADLFDDIAESDETNNSGASVVFAIGNLPTDDHGDSAADATPISDGSTTTGQIQDAGTDTDAFTYQASVGDQMTINLDPADAALPSGALFQVDLTTPTGATLASGEVTFPLVISFAAPESGDYLLTISGVGAASAAGAFAVSLDLDLGSVITGTPQDETITATDNAEEIRALAGDDRVNALAGSDVIYGGEGEDSISGGEGDDQIFGEARDDIIRGGPGNDTIDGGTFADRIFGDGGNDTIFGGPGNDVVLGRDGDDVIYGGDDRNNLVGEAGNDTIFGGLSFDTLNGGDGNDVLDGGDFPDQMRGGDGDDILLGGGSNDLMFGDAGNDTIDGGAGQDNQVGGAGADLLYGGDDRDKQAGGTEDDVIFAGAGADRSNGEAGDDLIYGGDDRDLIFGGTGDDTAYGDGDGDVILAREGADVLYGGEGGDKLYGEAGGDALFGDAGVDFLFAGAGNDTAFGGDDRDIIRLGTGDDTAFGGGGDDNIRGEAGDDILSGDAGFDFLLGEAGNDTLDGGAEADRIDGGLDDDRILGQAGDDSLTGNVGNDVVSGGDGDDLVRGGSGNDTLEGGAGNDTLIGEAGDDSFLFRLGSGDDTVLGFGGDDTILIVAAIFIEPPTTLITQISANQWRVDFEGNSITIRADAGEVIDQSDIEFVDLLFEP